MTVHTVLPDGVVAVGPMAEQEPLIEAIDAAMERGGTLRLVGDVDGPPGLLIRGMRNVQALCAGFDRMCSWEVHITRNEATATIFDLPDVVDMTVDHPEVIAGLRALVHESFDALRWAVRNRCGDSITVQSALGRIENAPQVVLGDALVEHINDALGRPTVQPGLTDAVRPASGDVPDPSRPGSGTPSSREAMTSDPLSGSDESTIAAGASTAPGAGTGTTRNAPDGYYLGPCRAHLRCAIYSEPGDFTSARHVRTTIWDAGTPVTWAGTRWATVIRECDDCWSPACVIVDFADGTGPTHVDATDLKVRDRVDVGAIDRLTVLLVGYVAFVLGVGALVARAVAS